MSNYDSNGIGVIKFIPGKLPWTSQLDSAVSYQNGGGTSPALEIDLHSRCSEEIFKWFLAAALFGAGNQACPMKADCVVIRL